LVAGILHDGLVTVTDLKQAMVVAGEVALRYFGTGVAVEWKGDGSPVTIADHSAEEAARTWISVRFPADTILGEEFGLTGSGSGRRPA
jgi:fructose-1,6-bisphosphatase/inositol monophosphatase family enzyme